jgi:hypothetical protein
MQIMRSLRQACLRHGEQSANPHAKRPGYVFKLVEYLEVYEQPLDGPHHSDVTDPPIRRTTDRAVAAR